FDSGPARFTVRSDDPTRLLLSADGKSTGGAQLETAPRATFYLQALAAGGTVNLRAVADGMDDVVYPIVLVPSGVVISFGGEHITLASDFQLAAGLTFDSAIPLSSFSSPITLRPGVDPIEVAISTTDTAIARPLASSVTFIPGVTASASFTVRPQNPGEATIRLTPPPAFHLSDALETTRVRIRLPHFVASPLTVGRDLITSFTFQSEFTPLPATIATTLVSSDPSRILLSTSADQPGQAQVTATFGPYQNSQVYVHGVAEGSAGIMISATGFDDSRVDVTVVPPTLSLSGPGTAFVGSPADLIVSANGQLRPGAQLIVNLRSSDPSVATVSPSVTFGAGRSQATAKITPLAAGSVIISADAPGLSPDSRLTAVLTIAAPP
ncbi:MAG TPA: hypothetical protein VGF59_11095, partial [Bryobacteraceae bacterium]